MDGLSEHHSLAFYGLAMALSIVVSFIAGWLVEWAADGLNAVVAYGLSAAIGLTVGWKTAAWWDAHVPPKNS